MTEKEFEQRIDAAANRFEKSMTKKWNNNKGFRRGVRAMSIAGEVCFFWGAKHFAEKGYETIAFCCAGLGIIGILADAVTIITSKKK